jgi:DNA-directed RNA polymerase omega subunit
MHKIDSKFRLVLIAAQRAEQLILGAAPKMKSPHNKPTYAALQEVKSNLIQVDFTPSQGESVHIGPAKE